MNKTAPSGKLASFITRLISGIILVVISVVLIIPGGYALLFGLLGISLIGMFELFRCFKIEKSILFAASCFLAAIYYVVILMLSHENFSLLFVTASFLIFMTIYVFSYPKYESYKIMASFFILFYVPVMLSFVYRLRMGFDGKYLVWLIFLGSWGCDTCAYAVGILFGKHKMSPVLSPKKSIEGAFGGVIGAALLGAVYAYIFKDNLSGFFSPVLSCSAICACSGAFSMIGDLCASAIKRNMGIKDYGKLIPGHGGVMDRFDSMIFISPVIYYLVIILQKADIL